MTPQEIVAEIDASNRALLKSLCAEQTDEVLALMNAAALKAFQMGARTAAAMIKGGMVVHLAQVKAAGK